MGTPGIQTVEMVVYVRDKYLFSFYARAKSRVLIAMSQKELCNLDDEVRVDLCDELDILTSLVVFPQGIEYEGCLILLDWQLHRVLRVNKGRQLFPTRATELLERSALLTTGCRNLDARAQRTLCRP